jgi:hypothetical protein
MYYQPVTTENAEKVLIEQGMSLFGFPSPASLFYHQIHICFF